MKKSALFALVLGALSLTANAQSNGGQVLFQDTETHISQPELRVFVNPMVCDLQILYPSSPRKNFSTSFIIKSLESLTEAEFQNLRKRALYQFTTDQQADVIIEPIFNSYITSNNTKELTIEITGFPAKYTNFRPLGKEQADVEMVRVVYPASYQQSVESKERK